jgi:glycosyltransferase involved in cell wall biosynthesis
MVILHVVAPSAVGGLERVVQGLARGLRGTGHDVHVAAVLSGSADHPFLAPLVHAGVPIHPLLLPPRAYLHERAAVAALCRRIRPEVLHTHGYRPDVVDVSVGRRLGIPTVSTVHGFTGGGWRNRFYEWLQRRALRRCDAVVAVSRPLAQRLERGGVPVERLHIVPNAWPGAEPPLDGIAARRALGVGPEGFVVGWVGRLSFEKGPDLLLDALRHLQDLPLAVSVLGDGPERASLEARARELGLDRCIQWHGTVPDAGRLFAAFDVFVLSSRTEGTPIVLFEAVAAGIPVVATRVGGVPDVVSPAGAALVPPHDALALAAEIRAVFRDPDAARARARAARTRLEHEFGVEPWLERYETVYRCVVRGATSRVAA